MAFTNHHLSFLRLSRCEQCPLAFRLAMLRADVETLAERTFSQRFSSKAPKEGSS